MSRRPLNRNSASSCFVLGPAGHPSGRTPHDEAEFLLSKLPNHLNQLFLNSNTKKCQTEIRT